MSINLVSLTEVDSPDKIRVVANLAEEIWTKHYNAILGDKQVKFMLEKFQSVNAITTQIIDGYKYFLIVFEKEVVGYIALKEINNEEVFLSKIYILKQFRRQGISENLIRNLREQYRDRLFKKFSLTVNKRNFGSIAFYETIGFRKTDETVTDIGNNFVMDDYVFELVLDN